MDDDQWVASGMCSVSAVRIERLRVWSEQAMRRCLELDARETEWQVLRDARMGRIRPVAAPFREHR